MRNLQSFSKITEALVKKRRHRRWAKVLSVMICVVVFCTTYALILPAITLERDAVVLDCKYAASHTHTADCYDAESNLICGYADFVVHTHDDKCYDTDGNLVCTLNEIQAHTHTGDCYEEQNVLICELEESEEHIHDDNCYESKQVLTCGKEEIILHTHTEDCYDEGNNLICDQIEVTEHIHTDECFAAVEIGDEDEDEDEDAGFMGAFFSLFSSNNGIMTIDGGDMDSSNNTELNAIRVTAGSISPTGGINPNDMISDSVTASGSENIMGDYGTRYAGRVWTDKSVLTGENSFTEGAYTVTNDSDFLTVFSALGSSRVIHEQASTPLDVVVVLDVSRSMVNTPESEDSRIVHSVASINNLIGSVMDLNDDSRVGIVTFSDSAETLLTLDRYTAINGTNYLSVTGYNFSNTTTEKTFQIAANVKNSSGDEKNVIKNAGGYTYIQGGFYEGMEMLATATETSLKPDNETKVYRTPVLLLVTDGYPSQFEASVDANGSDAWWNFGKNPKSEIYTNKVSKSARLLATLMTASYEKQLVAAHYSDAGNNYEAKPLVFTVGIDLAKTEETDANVGLYDYTQAVLDPKEGFTTDKTQEQIAGIVQNNDLSYENALALAYNAWMEYKDGKSPGLRKTVADGGGDYVFNHPSIGDINDINYVDEYFSISSNPEEIVEAFENILAKATGEAFVPTEDFTGQDGNGLIYTDPLGKYMEVKEIKGVLIDGKVVPLSKENNTYYATIPEIDENGVTTKHPIYGTEIGGSQVKITVETDNDGMQTLRVAVPSEILPAVCQTVTIDKDGNTTISKEESMPLRVLYTVGFRDDVKDKSGALDLSKIDPDYLKDNNGNGKVYFYSNFYDGQYMDSDTSKTYGNAVVTFNPSADNRYYYFKTNRVIYEKVTKSGTEPEVFPADAILKTVDDEGNETPGEWSVSDPVRTDANTLIDTQSYYIIIDYYRQIEGSDQNEDGSYPAEHVYHIVSRTGAELKSSAALVDYSTKGLVTGGEEIGSDQVLATVIGAPRLGRLNWVRQLKPEEGKVPNTADYFYAPTYTGQTSDDELDPGMVVGTESFTVYLGNNGRLAVETSNFEISKKVVNAPTVPKGEEASSFTFKVELKDSADEVLTGAYTYKVYDVTYDEDGKETSRKESEDVNDNPITGYIGTKTVNGETVSNDTITLKDGQVAVIEYLPVGTQYTITEISGDYSIKAVRTDNGTSETISAGIGKACVVNGILFYNTTTFANTSTVAFTNTYPTDLTIVKVDGADNTTRLEGAEFVLYYTVKNEGNDETTRYYYYNNNGSVTWVPLSDGSPSGGGYTLEDVKLTTGDISGEQPGEIEFKNVPDGAYTLEEVAAPDGYNPLTEPIDFSVENGRIKGSRYVDSVDDTRLIVPNSTGIELPSTGGPGKTLYTMAGLLLMCGAACLMYRYRMRRKEVHK